MTLQVELVSPERILFSGEAQMVTARTTDGDIAFLTGHTPFLGLLVEWPVVIKLEDGTEENAAVHGGFVEVSHDRVTILSDLAEMSSQIDVERAYAARERAEAHLRDEHDAAVESGLRRAQARIKVASRVGEPPSR